MRRREFVEAWTGCMAGALLGCSRQEREPGRSELLVAAVPFPAMAGFYLALERGYFGEAGVEVRAQQHPVEGQLLPLLAAGKMDAALVAMQPSIINAIAHGAAIRIVAGREYANPECGSWGRLLARREKFPDGLHDIRQLRGRRVSRTRATGIDEFALDALLQSGGMSQADLDVISLEYLDGLAALASGRIDAMVSSSQFDRHPYWVSPEYVHGVGLADVQPGFQYSHIVFGKSLLSGDREPGVRFLAAYLRGARDYSNGGTPQFLWEFGRRNGLDESLIQEVCRETFVIDGRIDERSLELYVDWTVQKGYCERAVAANELLDHSFLDEALRYAEGTEGNAG